MARREIVVLVTVGSTSFDGLIQSMTSTASLENLQRAGVRKLIVQHGRGPPPTPTPSPSPESLEVVSFAYAPSLTPYYGEADIVTTHCGAGCVFEAIGFKKHVVAVPNRSLMDDHQGELANELDALGALSVAEVNDVAAVVATTCGLVHMGVEAKGEDACPRNTSAFAEIVAEEVRDLV